LVDAPNKYSAPFRWMGCTFAVCDCVVQLKADEGAEKSRAQRGTKRRGSRSGSRNARKSRRLVTADPDSYNPTSTEARTYRANYREARQVSYVGRSVWTIVKVWKAAERISNSGDVVKRRHLYEVTRRKLRNLVDVTSRISGSPLLMARIRVYRAVQEAGGPIRRIRWGNHWVRPDDALESFEDFLSVRYPPEPDLPSVSERNEGKKPLTINLLDWLTNTQRSMAPDSQPRVKTRAHVANAPCVFCAQAPCARPGLNGKGVPLCKRLGILTRPLDRRRK
jgi:hypothetical protein